MSVVDVLARSGIPSIHLGSTQATAVFIFFDKRKTRSQYDQQIDDLIQMLATIYFYSSDKRTLEQLAVLVSNRVLK